MYPLTCSCSLYSSVSELFSRRSSGDAGSPGHHIHAKQAPKGWHCCLEVFPTNGWPPVPGFLLRPGGRDPKSWEQRSDDGLQADTCATNAESKRRRKRPQRRRPDVLMAKYHMSHNTTAAYCHRQQSTTSPLPSEGQESRPCSVGMATPKRQGLKGRAWEEEKHEKPALFSLAYILNHYNGPGTPSVSVPSKTPELAFFATSLQSCPPGHMGAHNIKVAVVCTSLVPHSIYSRLGCGCTKCACSTRSLRPRRRDRTHRQCVLITKWGQGRCTISRKEHTGAGIGGHIRYL